MEISDFGPFRAPDDALTTRCLRVLADLAEASDPDLLQALADPRPAHRALFQALTPESAPEFAGNYRGSDYDSLRDKVVFYAFNGEEGTTEIVGPHRVAERMAQYADLVREHGLRPAASVEERLATVAAIITFFGVVHPFVDGNGHVQRLTAQALLERSGLGVGPAWRVHPRPYGEDMHRALAAHDVAAVAERLKSFLA